MKQALQLIVKVQCLEDKETSYSKVWEDLGNFFPYWDIETHAFDKDTQMSKARVLENKKVKRLGRKWSP